MMTGTYRLGMDRGWEKERTDPNITKTSSPHRMKNLSIEKI